MTAKEEHPHRHDLHGRRILLGVSGGIAAYKAVELTRLLKKAGADVQVLMTPDAARFIAPLTLGTVSEHAVLSSVFTETEDGSWTKHITLGRWADLFVVAPATANTLAKLAYGFSDTMLTATALAARCPLLVCPAMDHDMFVHPATQRNLDVLAQRGASVMQPAYGELASGLIGHGRLPEPIDIRARIAELLAEHGILRGRHVLVTAGPTREHVDPVRYLSNPSSGKMGFAVAAAARRRGARVTLVAGPSTLETPDGVDRIDVESADHMYEAVMRRRDADIIVMAAAVSDYTPVERAPSKLKKGDEHITLRLRRTRDILRELGETRSDEQVLVGFAMETEDGTEHAKEKLASKHLDWIVLNRLSDDGAGFAVDTNRVVLLGRSGSEEAFPLLSKRELADHLLDRVVPSTPKPAA